MVNAYVRTYLLPRTFFCTYSYVHPYLRVLMRTFVFVRTYAYVLPYFFFKKTKKSGPFSGPFHRERVPEVRVRASVLTFNFFYFSIFRNQAWKFWLPYQKTKSHILFIHSKIYLYSKKSKMRREFKMI